MTARASLRTQLVVCAVALLAVVCAVIGTVTAVAVNASLEERLDDELRASVQRSYGPPHAPRPASDDLWFVAVPGQPIGTVGARTGPAGELTGAARSTDPEDGGPGTDLRERLTGLTSEQRAALASVPLDGRPHTVELPGLGNYRVQYGRLPAPPAPPGAVAGAGEGLLVGLPRAGVESTLRTLVLVEVCVSAAGLAAAALAGTAMVRIALRPLRRVAATAERVTRLSLHSGDVVLPHRVEERDTDPRTEAGQVGAALNSLLGHVGSALEARQASETRVRRFVADASHELRTPLASIRGYAELTRRMAGHGAAPDGPAASDGSAAPDGPDARHALDRIEAEAARMTGLVEDLLLLARLDAGRPLETADVPLSSLVVDAVGDARIAGHGHVWRLDLPAEPVEVRGDARRLQQVLVNLLANARTHTPPGTTVTARLRTPPAAGRDEGCVVIEVEDDGPGVPEATLPHVFERFARGDAARSRAHGSTGLGLAIVDAVVAAHHGHVTVDSAPGRTVFAVRLPAAPRSDRGGSQAAHSVGTPS